MLEARNLSKKFGANQALSELNLRVDGGELVCLLGANGAGKTTTINLFLGFLDPSQGCALVDSVDVNSDPVGTKRKLAYIPEQVALYPTLSGFENLKYFAALGLGETLGDIELFSLIERVGLTRAQAKAVVSSYSKGMRQKIGVAIALAKEAKAYLLDEPLSGLDPSAANDFCALMEELRSDGAAILMATHDLFRAKEIATRVGIMKAGQLVDMIDPRDISSSDLEQIYLSHMRSEVGGREEGEAA